MLKQKIKSSIQQQSSPDEQNSLDFPHNLSREAKATNQFKGDILSERLRQAVAPKAGNKFGASSAQSAFLHDLSQRVGGQRTTQNVSGAAPISETTKLPDLEPVSQRPPSRRSDCLHPVKNPCNTASVHKFLLLIRTILENRKMSL